jgi:hypothetical protein
MPFEEAKIAGAGKVSIRVHKVFQSPKLGPLLVI